MKELYQDRFKVLGYVQDLYSDDQNNKRELVRLWERNAAFSNGNQNFNDQFSPTVQTNATNFLISPYQDNRTQMFTTNEIEPIIRTLVSYLTRARPTVEVYPSDSSEDARNRSKVAERVIDAKYDLDNESQLAKKAAYFSFVFGTVFRKDYWDASIGRNAELPVYDELGNEVIDPATGKVKTQTRNTGDSTVAMLPPFLISFDWSYEWDQLPCIIESYLMPLEWVHEAYDRQEPGYTGMARQVTENSQASTSVSTWEALKYATPFTYGSKGPSSKGKVLVQEVYIKPNYEFPRGRMVVIAGSQVVYDTEKQGSPYFMNCRPVMWHPYTMFTYAPYVGRLLGKSLVESLIPQQMRLNEINGAIINNANTLAKVDVLAVENQMKRGVMNGMGGNIYTYRMIPNAPPPQKWQGVPLPEQFFKEKDALIEQMVREAGTNLIMTGEAPKGVTAASALELLLDNSTTQHSDMSISWEKFTEEGFTKKLRVIRQFNKLPNEDIVDYLRTMSKDNLDLEISSFVGEDIGDGWNLKVESGSTIPKSEKAKRELYMNLSEKGMLGPIQEDSPRGARLRKELLSKLGEKGFDMEESADVEKAKWENQRLLKGLPVEVWEHDNHEIHASIVMSQMKDPKFLERASDKVKQACDDHLQGHLQMLAMKSSQNATPQGNAEAMAPGNPGEESLEGPVAA